MTNILMQMDEGVWQLKVGPPGNPTYTVYVWSRSNMTSETFVSTQPNPLPLAEGFVATPVTGTPSFANASEFVAWCCQQVNGNPKLYVVNCESTYTSATHQCVAD